MSEQMSLPERIGDGLTRMGSMIDPPNSFDIVKQDHLSLAATTGESLIVEAMLKVGCAPSGSDALGETALHHAARLGLVEIVRLLISRGALLNARSRGGSTALELADEYGQAEVVETLRELGAAVPSSWARPRLTETIGFLNFALLPAEFEQRLRDRLSKISDLNVPLERAVLRSAVLPFYDDTILVAIEDPQRHGPRERFVLVSAPRDQAFCSLMNWTNEPIYSWNERFGVQISNNENIVAYLKFFFYFVRGQLGRYVFVESAEDLDWLPTASDHDRARATKHLVPIHVVETTADFVRLHGLCSFNDALFSTDAVFFLNDGVVTVSDDHGRPEQRTVERGHGLLTNSDLLEEELPLRVPGPPSIFD